MKGHRSVFFAKGDGEKLEPLMTIQGCLEFFGVCGSGLEKKHRGIFKQVLDFQVFGDNLLGSQFSIGSIRQKLIVIVPELAVVLGDALLKSQVVVKVD
jgi:hypothetical protein